MAKASVDKSARRAHLKMLGGLGLGTMIGVPGSAQAQSYPAKPVRWIIPYPPGGGTDVAARTIAKYWEPALGTTLVVDNKPGGQTVLATGILANSTADGYTIMTVVDNFPVLPMMYKTLPFSIERDFEYISTYIRNVFFLIVKGDSPIKNVRDAVAAMKARGDKMNFASYGIGSTSHLAMEGLCEGADAHMTHVPFQGAAPAMNALLGGHVDLLFADTLSSAPFVNSGQVRALAISTRDRNRAFPNVETLHEQGIANFNWYSWHGLIAPRNTPPAVAGKLQETLHRAMQDPGLQKQFTERGWDVFVGTPEEFKRFVASEAASIRAMVDRRKIKLTVD